MSTIGLAGPYGSGMWDSHKDKSLEGSMIGQAIRETEKEIHDAAFDDAPEDNSYDDSLEQLEDFDGETHSDDYYTEEHFGVDHTAQPEQPQPRYAQPEPEQPPPDMYSDPEAWLNHATQRFADARYGGPVPPQYQQQHTGAPDLFAEPERALEYAAQRGAQMAQAAQFDQQRVNSSLSNAAEMYPGDFQEAFKAITSLDQRNPSHQAIIQNIWRAPDPGRELLQVYGAIKARDRVDRIMGGQGFLPRDRINYAARAHGMTYEPPTTDEGRAEQEIFNSAFEDF